MGTPATYEQDSTTAHEVAVGDQGVLVLNRMNGSMLREAVTGPVAVSVTWNDGDHSPRQAQTAVDVAAQALARLPG